MVRERKEDMIRIQKKGKRYNWSRLVWCWWIKPKIDLANNCIINLEKSLMVKKLFRRVFPF